MGSGRTRQPTIPAAIEAWCLRWLGAEPSDVLFQVGHLSQVIGLRLPDLGAVVVKVRPPSERLVACVIVQRHLWAAGFPCPEPLAGPAPLGPLSATAETLVEGGSQLSWTDDSPRGRLPTPLDRRLPAPVRPELGSPGVSSATCCVATHAQPIAALGGLGSRPTGHLARTGRR